MSSILSLFANPQVQSPYLFLQAAGSDGADGTTQGIHTRWTFLRSLGDNHLPKGHLTESGSFASTADFNIADDFVKLYKIPYDILYKTIVDFNDAPATLHETGTSRYWLYSIIVQQDISSTLTPTSTTNTVQVRFTDVSVYDAVRASIDPSTDTLDFMRAYTGVVEVELLNKLQFAVDTELLADPDMPTSPAILRIETISLSENFPGEPTYISCRHKFLTMPGSAKPREGTVLVDNTAFLIPTSNAPHKMFNDNIKYVRFAYSAQVVEKVILESYEDFMDGRDMDDWYDIGDFSLSLNDTEVMDRLDGTGLNINGNWPKYNQAVANGKFTVRVDNYIDRWDGITGYYSGNTDPNQQLKQAVLDYLDLSKVAGNPEGRTTLNGSNNSHYDMNYVDMFRIVSLDYHVARMLGLGHIDAGNYTTPYIYMAKYFTDVSLETHATALPLTHLYMSLPTTVDDTRKCVKPKLESLTYGLTVDNGTNSPIQLTDANGYSLNDPSRYVCLNRTPIELIREMEPFFNTPEEFCFGESTAPVIYGIEYRKDTDPGAREPELAHDPVYVDLNTPTPIPETIGVLERDNPIYMHRETEEGIHQYALYGVNWFSRASSPSNILTTDETQFAKINTLLPPLNFACQLIQEESPLIFTSSREQTRLSDYIATNPVDDDYTLVRATFEWNHLHNIAYQYADKVQLFFRESAPENIRGNIKSVTLLANNRVEVRTESFPDNSSPEIPKPMIEPLVTPGQESHYVNGIFSTGSDQFYIESVAQSNVSGEGAIFVLRQSRTMVTNFNTTPSQPQEIFSSPTVGSQFIAIENMGEPSNWTDLHTFEVELQDFGSTYTETVTYPDGSSRILPIGGIYEPASVVELPILDNGGVTVEYNVSGVYNITFSSYTLLENYQTDVEWSGGTVRIADQNPITGLKKMRELQVVSILRDTDGSIISPLTISAFDPLKNDPNTVYPATVSTGLAPTVMVNFHPGYRVYINAIQNTNFIDNVILPAQGDMSKYTYMAARSIDSSEGIQSALTTPATLLAREIVTPSQPGLPAGPLYATRPDYYGKASYTFDVLVDINNREPFALVFYKATARKLLDRLYKKETYETILSDLAALLEDETAFDQDRWNDLANVVYDSFSGEFKKYVVDSDGYRFPAPDNDLYELPDVPGEFPFDGGTLQPGDTYTWSTGSRPMAEIIAAALNGAYIPLTEQPVRYSELETGMITSSRKPVLRDLNGDLLPHDSPDYDPFPMAVKYSDQVRFSDFNIDGAANDIYFYYAIELTNDLKFGQASPVTGPIHLVNAMPPDSPKIRKVTSRLANPVTGLTTGVILEVNKYAEREGVKKIRLLRGTDADAITSVRTMLPVADFDITSQLGDDQLIITDDFSDLDFPPYGDPLFYRIVALREITNEFGVTEYIPSRPSNVVMANIVDVINPESPVLRSYCATVWQTQLNDVTISWNPVGYNITYRLQQMQRSGTWKQIYEVRTNDDVIEYLLPDPLVIRDSEGNAIYTRFRVQTENTSGLLNLSNSEMIVISDCSNADAQIDDIVSYKDSSSAVMPLSDLLADVNTSLFPGHMIFADTTAPLPAGHLFNRIEITVDDGLTHSATAIITSAGGSVQFNHGDGTGIVFDGSVANVIYGVNVTLFTNVCPTGINRSYSLRYGPCNALLSLTDLVSFYEASSGTLISPFAGGIIDNGYAYPDDITITDVSVLPAGHSFSAMEIIVQDSLGGQSTKTIGAPGGNVVFTNGDADIGFTGLQLDSAVPNLSYIVTVNLSTDLCSSVQRVYSAGYTFSPYNALIALTSLLSYSDDESFSMSPLETATDITNGEMCPGGSITLQDISVLPAGHTFVELSVNVTDELGNVYSDTIAEGGALTINDGDGDLVLNDSSQSTTFFISGALTTDLCPEGIVFDYQLTYIG